MKKYLSFFILFIPWLFSLSILSFVNQFNRFTIYYYLISIILYISISLYIYTKVENSYYNDFLLNIVLLYITHQSLNFIIFYYENLFSSILFGISQLFILLKMFIEDKTFFN